MRKVSFLIILFIMAILVAIFFPWHKVSEIGEDLLGTNHLKASLKVYSLGGDMKVYVDGEEKGEIGLGETYLEVFPIEQGDHVVQLIRNSSNDEYYNDFKKIIWFERGFDAVISWEVGPSQESSSGWIMYAKKLNENKSEVKLNIDCGEVDCSVMINGEERETIKREYPLSVEDDYELRLYAEGYQDLNISILPENEEERSRLGGYEIFVEASLYFIPL